MSNVQEEDSLLFHGNRGRNKLLVYGAIVLFIAWNILLFILAVVAIAKANNVHSSGSSYTYAPISRSFTVGSNQNLVGSKVVSLLPDGRLRLGGGTTVYLTRGSTPNITAGAVGVVGTTFNPPAGAFASLTDSELAFIAYTQGGKVFGTLGVVSVNGFTLNTWSKPVEIKGLTTTEAVIPLNRFTGPKKSFVLAGGGNLVVGTIQNEAPSTLEFTVSDPQPYGGSSHTLLARLSDHAFAIAYFKIIDAQTQQHLMQATVGNVTFDASGNFDSLKMAPGFNYSALNGPYHAMAPLHTYDAPNVMEFMLSYPALSAVPVNASDPPPPDTLAILKGRWDEQSQTLIFGPSTALKGVKPNAMMTAAALPTSSDWKEPKAVIVFIDEREDNALTAVTVIKDPKTFAQHDGLAFGSTFVLSDNAFADDFQTKNGQVVPFIAANYIDENSLAISFSDFANLGKITTTVVGVNPHTMELSLAGETKFVTSEQNPSFTANYWWVVAAPLRFNSQVGYVLWQYLETGNAESDVVQQSIVEVAPPPFGLVSENVKSVTGGSPASVVVSGVYKFAHVSPPFSDSVGRYWYTSTLGELYERNGNDASIGYVIAGPEDDRVLLSMNSRIGVSISPNELLLIDEL